MTPMAEPDRLLQQFIADDRRSAGEADPAGYLDRVTGSQRDELEALIDAYLAQAPRRPFDAAAFAASPARPAADGLWRSVSGAGGRWPAVLPALRHRAAITRAELIRRLTEALHVPAQEAKVGAYYHAMEQGTLPASGVQDRVLEALGEIVGESAQRLRELGRVRPQAGPTAVAPGLTFARTATPDADAMEAAEPVTAQAPPGAAPSRDKVDELFTGASGP